MPPPTILIVDDESKICELIGRFLKAKGFAVAVAHEGMEALEKCETDIPDVALLDIRMPKMDGVECLTQIKKRYPDMEVIMATAVEDLQTGIACMQVGAFGYLNKPINLEQLHVEINRALERRRLVLENRDYQVNLEKKVEERTREVYRLNDKLKDSFLKSIRITLGVVETYDAFLAGHSKRVSVWTVPLARAMGLSEQEIIDIEIAALLHEIGQIALPEHIKNSSFDELSEEEVKMMKQYPILTQKILAPSEELNRPGVIIRHHLERLDGSGFPDGLKGEEIPLGSRILSVVNAYDELMTRRRFTTEKFSSDKAKEEFVFSRLKECAGKYYQADIIARLGEELDNYHKQTKTKTLCTVNELKPGMVVASDIFLNGKKLLIKKGSILSHIHVTRLSTFCQMRALENRFFVFK